MFVYNNPKQNRHIMNFSFLDNNVSHTMNVFLIIANIINLLYNIPQMVKTYQTKSTRDFSSWFLFLRIIGNTIWMVYSIEIDSFQMLINNIVTIVASMFIGYYKIIEIIRGYRKQNIYKMHISFTNGNDKCNEQNKQLILQNDVVCNESTVVKNTI